MVPKIYVVINKNTSFTIMYDTILIAGTRKVKNFKIVVLLCTQILIFNPTYSIREFYCYLKKYHTVNDRIKLSLYFYTLSLQQFVTQYQVINKLLIKVTKPLTITKMFV